jgi:hypothetical protein
LKSFLLTASRVILSRELHKQIVGASAHVASQALILGQVAHVLPNK